MCNPGDTGVQSVCRALIILDCLAERGELRVTQIGKILNVHKATASRLIATLARHGLARRDPDSDKYRLGFKLLYLASAATAGLDLVQRARPILESLAESSGEIVTLAVLDVDRVIYIDQIAGTRAVVSVGWDGRRIPIHCSSTGKLLLAFLDSSERDSLLNAPLERHTPRSIVDPKRLRIQLDKARKRGYAQTFGELEEGLNGVAAPVRRADGKVVAAVAVSGPEFRVQLSELARITRLTIDSGDSISRNLGHLERRPPVRDK